MEHPASEFYTCEVFGGYQGVILLEYIWSLLGNKLVYYFSHQLQWNHIAYGKWNVIQLHVDSKGKCTRTFIMEIIMNSVMQVDYTSTAKSIS